MSRKQFSLQMALSFVLVLHQMWILMHYSAWSLNKSIGWGYDFTNFTFWIGYAQDFFFPITVFLLIGNHYRAITFPLNFSRGLIAYTLLTLMFDFIFPGTRSLFNWGFLIWNILLFYFFVKSFSK